MKGSTGSECTGQAAGAAGLLMSYAKQRGTPLTSNEVKQILTLTADDVLPGDTLGTGAPDPSQVGWDQHYGYGRVNLRHALERLGVPALGIPAKIPPEPRRLRRLQHTAAPPRRRAGQPEPGRRDGRLPARHRLHGATLRCGRPGA